MNSLISSGVGGLISTGINEIGGMLQENRNRKMMKQQQNLQQQNMAYANDLNLDLWNKTNVGAQMKHMKNAGLNIGLMYGGQGQGVTGTQGAGNSTIPDTKGYNNAQGMAIGLAAARQQAEIDNLNADTKQKNAEAEFTSGTKTSESQARTADLTQGVSNKIAQEKLTIAQTKFQDISNNVSYKTMYEVIEQAKIATKNARVGLEIAERDNNFDAATYKDRVEIVQNEAVASLLNNNLIKSKINLTDTQAESLVHGIRQKYQELSIQTANMNIGKFEASIKRDKMLTDYIIGKLNVDTKVKANELRQWELIAGTIVDLIDMGGDWYNKSQDRKIKREELDRKY